ncbi:MAG: putative manganese transporter [Pseudomonadota bacterium]|nr:putative manganese transporter [Pseudomonadota bacterium]
MATNLIHQLIDEPLNHAFIETAPFVAATMAVFLFFESRTSGLLKEAAKSSTLGISLSAVLGAMPGCTGIMVVVRQFAHGALPFCCLVAAMTATIGDAAFVLASRAPTLLLLFVPVNILSGVILGVLTKRVHGVDYLKVTHDYSIKHDHSHDNNEYPMWYAFIWSLCVVVALLVFFFPAYWEEPHTWGSSVGYLGTLFVLLGKLPMRQSIKMKPTPTRRSMLFLNRVIKSSNFLMKWIILGYMVTAIPTLIFGDELNITWLTDHAWSPIVAALIGVVPSCGPQIVVATLYTQHMLPLSAQLINIISTNGDAFFPVFAMQPKASLMATWYGVVFALAVGYGVVFLNAVVNA